MTLWIDRDDHLLAKMVSKIDWSKLGDVTLPTLPDGSKMADAVKGMGEYEDTEVYSDIVVNKPIPDSTFSRTWKP